MASPATFKIRSATYTDLPEISRTLACAFVDDPLFGDYIHPYRKQYPDDVHLYWLKRLPADYFDWSNTILVATENDEDGKEIIVGMAQWCRKGSKANLERLGWRLKPWDPRNLLAPLSNLYTKSLPINRAASPANEPVLENSHHFTVHHWTGPRSESFYLALLAVHPSHRHKGIGRALVAWGLDKAESEGVSASVIAAEGKDGFYQNCGFEVCVGWAGDGEGNLLAAVAGGNIWFKDGRS